MDIRCPLKIWVLSSDRFCHGQFKIIFYLTRIFENYINLPYIMTDLKFNGEINDSMNKVRIFNNSKHLISKKKIRYLYASGVTWKGSFTWVYSVLNNELINSYNCDNGLKWIKKMADGPNDCQARQNIILVSLTTHFVNHDKLR